MTSWRIHPTGPCRHDAIFSVAISNAVSAWTANPTFERLTATV